jgi:hypothetical protein
MSLFVGVLAPLGILASLGVLAPLAARDSAAAESVTAIDILLLPDETMVDHAQANNARLRANYPAGFALDAEHRPHITLLQRYVRTNDLDQVFAAVQRVFDEQRPVGWDLEATGCFFVDFDNMGLAGIVIRPTPQLRTLQEAIVEAVEPYTVPDGTSAAFVTAAGQTEINASSRDYVGTFVPEQLGAKYGPHVTTGVGQFDFVRTMKAAPFADFKFKVADAAVFHLGDYCTAAKELWKWQPPAGE